LDQLRRRGTSEPVEITTRGDDPAAIIFTTGSTGPPKGVLYEHGNFDHQSTQIQQHYGVEPGTVDVSGFPLFALFNIGMGGTTVFPDMDFTRPASVDPEKIIAAVKDWQAGQTFGSPALWNRVGEYCEQRKIRLPTLRRILSAGAPVPGHVLRRMKSCLTSDAEVFTPYGATEALPVASISASEVLSETQQQTDQGAGVCVGRRFSGIRWQVIRIDDAPLATLDEVEPLPRGEVGELIVQGPVVTRHYVTRREANALAKIADGQTFWHRMGDVGYLDDQDRFWFCGRKSHRVQTPQRTLLTICCEAVFNTHPAVFRSALVGVGPAGSQRPMLFVEPHPANFPKSAGDRGRLRDELRELGQRFDHTREIGEFHFRHSLPVDIRHNSKIFREKLVPKQ
jgi:acyl-CoA synthetase (AMP-forming)/AMP-acid ligase II